MRFHFTPDMMFVLNAVIVFLVVWVAIRFLNNRGGSQFREDLWGEGLKKRNPKPVEIHKTLDYIALEAPETEPIPAKENTKSPYRAPNFQGRPHEVLGIDPEADRDTIQAAFKFWIKRYHPDRVQHLGPGYVKQANLRTEQLNEAKKILLKRFE